MITVSHHGTNYQVPEPNDAFTQSLTNLLIALAQTTLRATTGSLVFGSVAQDATATQTFALAGATTGVPVSVSPTAALPAGVTAYAYVSAAGIVTIAVVNAAALQAVTAAFNLAVNL